MSCLISRKGSDKYENFRESVEAFYHQPDQEEENRWLGAFPCIAMRRGKSRTSVLLDVAQGRSPKKRPTQIGVERLDKESTRYTSADKRKRLFCDGQSGISQSYDLAQGGARDGSTSAPPGYRIELKNAQTFSFTSTILLILRYQNTMKWKLATSRKLARTLGIYDLRKTIPEVLKLVFAPPRK